MAIVVAGGFLRVATWRLYGVSQPAEEETHTSAPCIKFWLCSQYTWTQLLHRLLTLGRGYVNHCVHASHVVRRIAERASVICRAVENRSREPESDPYRYPLMRAQKPPLRRACKCLIARAERS